MDQESRDIIKKRLTEIPESLRKAFAELDLLGRVRKIITKEGLRVDDGGMFEDEVMLVLLGLEHPDAFVSNLTSRLHISLSVVERLVIDTENEIFHPVRESLMKMFPTGEHAPSVESSTTATTQPIIQATPHPIVQPSVQPAPRQPHATPTPSSVPSASITHTLPKDSAQTKLEQSFRIPASATTIKEGPAVSQKVIDPYREPVE
ncbi:hypothetical protein IPJ70_03125 [Candidatus Campbellbacteria bacterium]|nr:MAG: hypothetical protein IPJ70_03125 [Candidatus Campbellbacteria bacterium]